MKTMSIIQDKKNAVAKEYDVKEQTYRVQKRELERQLADAKAKLTEAIMKDVQNSTKATQAEVKKWASKIDEVKCELPLVDAKVNAVNDAKINALRELFNELVGMVEEAEVKCNQYISESEVELMKNRCKMVLDLKAVYDNTVEYRQMVSELEGISNELGINFHKRISIRQLPLFAPSVDSKLVPTDQEILDAFHRGQAHYFIQYFAKTGRLVRNDEARRLLAEMAKAADKEDEKE